mgnify:FL=1
MEYLKILDSAQRSFWAKGELYNCIYSWWDRVYAPGGR